MFKFSNNMCDKLSICFVLIWPAVTLLISLLSKVPTQQFIYSTYLYAANIISHRFDLA